MLVLKDVLYVVKTMFLGGAGGGKSSSQTSTLQTKSYYPHYEYLFNYIILFLSKERSSPMFS